MDTEEFKAVGSNEAGRAARARMACSLLENQNEYIGKGPLQIRSIFGDPDGYYISEAFPAYGIGGTGEKYWQILFLIDNHGRISEIVVHRSW